MLYFSATFFVYHLRTVLLCCCSKRKFQSKVILTIFPESDEITWIGSKIPINSKTYVRLIYIQFRLFVNVKRTNIFHKYSEFYTVQVPSSSSSVFSVQIKLYFTDLYKTNVYHCNLAWALALTVTWNFGGFEPWFTFWQCSGFFVLYFNSSNPPMFL